MRVTRHGRPADLEAYGSESVVLAFRTLDHMTRWAFSQSPTPDIDVVAQDEFTHDVIVHLGDRLWLVFDST